MFCLQENPDLCPAAVTIQTTLIKTLKEVNVQSSMDYFPCLSTDYKKHFKTDMKMKLLANNIKKSLVEFQLVNHLDPEFLCFEINYNSTTVY